MHKLTVTYLKDGVAELSYYATSEQAAGSMARLAKEQGLRPIPGAVVCLDEFGRLSLIQIEEVPSDD